MTNAKYHALAKAAVTAKAVVATLQTQTTRVVVPVPLPPHATTAAAAAAHAWTRALPSFQVSECDFTRNRMGSLHTGSKAQPNVSTVVVGEIMKS